MIGSVMVCGVFRDDKVKQADSVAFAFITVIYVLVVDKKFWVQEGFFICRFFIT